VDITILLAIAGGAVFLAIAVGTYILISGLRGPTPLEKAAETIDVAYAPASAAPQEEKAKEKPFAPAVQQVVSLGRRVTPKGASAKLQRWLDYAGNPAGWPPERLMEMQGIGLIVFALLAFVLALSFGFNTVWIVFFTLLLAGVGFWAPFIVIFDLGQRRQQTLRRELPDAIDLLTLSVEAGMGFEGAVAQIAATMPGALSREFARLLHEMQMGMRRADALRALSERTTVIELRTVCTSLLQATELGIPIVDVLREQAKEMRVRRRQNAETAAAKVPVKVVFPLVLCLLPALFVVVIGPGVIRILQAFSNGF
jgi:tight adherence protein C